MGKRQAEIVLGASKRKPGARPGRWLLALILLLAAGAAVPHILSSGLPRGAGTPADALFVLTGGEGRIEEAYRLWRAGRGKELYVIGTRGNVRIEQILPGRPAPSPEERERIHLEGWSENTLENAFSVKSVVNERAFRSLLLVTSDYHMARAHFAVRKVLPAGVSIAVTPVPSDWKNRRSFLRTMRRHFLEGWKYWGYRLFLAGE